LATNLLRRFALRISAAYGRFVADEGTRLAAAMAYYVALSFFPLLIVLTAGVSAALEWTVGGQDARRQILSVIEQQSSPALREQIERALTTVSQGALAGGLLGFLILLVTSIAIFAQFEAAFDKIWNVPSPPRVTWQIWIRQQLLSRLKALAMLLAVGAFVITVIITSLCWSLLQSAAATAGYPLPSIQASVGLLINLGFNFLAFTLIYRFVPKPDVPWRIASQGGAVAGLLWEAGRQILAAYLTRSSYPSVYGIIGSFIAIMLWAYYAMIVIFFGAEYTRAACLEADGSTR
jgi:membrane protein